MTLKERPGSASFRTIAARDPGNAFGEGAAAASIAAAAKSLGVRWPRSYAAFLTEVGWFESGTLTVYGLPPRAHRHLDVVRNARAERSAWAGICPLPKGLVPISPDGCGGHFCLDTARMARGECPVVYWDHELVGPAYRPEYAGRTFESFFRRQAPRPERPPPRVITLERALAQIHRTARRSGLVGNDTWKRGAKRAEIAAAEADLRVALPSQVRDLLRTVDGFEHAGGWNHFGVGAHLEQRLTVAWNARRLWRGQPRGRTLLPLAMTWAKQLCCVDLADIPLRVVALDFRRRTRMRSLPPLPFELWLWRIAKGELDPWRSA